MCSLESPCGSIVRVAEITATHAVMRCLNGHTHLIGTPPPAPTGGTARALAYDSERCCYCRAVLLSPAQSITVGTGRAHRRCVLAAERERMCGHCGKALEPVNYQQRYHPACAHELHRDRARARYWRPEAMARRATAGAAR